MSLIAKFIHSFALTPCLITSETVKDGLQSGLVQINQHWDIVNKPSDKVAAIWTASVSECQLELFGQLLGNVRLGVGHDNLIIAACWERCSSR